MTASNTPKPGDDRAPDERPDATTEILAGLTDPDGTPTEVLGPDADHTPTAVLGPDADHTPTEKLADADHTTKVLPEASAHSTRVPPKPKASDPTTRVLPDAAPAAANARPASVPPKAPSAGAAASGRPATGAAQQASGEPGATPRGSATPPAPPAPAPASATGLPPHGSAGASPRFPRPHVRWAGIIWGLVFAVAAALLLWVLAEPARRDAVGDWWASLTPIGFALTALLVAGGLLLIGGVAGLARRLAHRRA